MSRSLRISEELYAVIEGHNREDETVEETLRRLVGGPHPEEVAGILSSETADPMRRRLGDEREIDGPGD